MRWVHELFDELQLDAATRERIWSGTAAAWLRLPGASPAAETPGRHERIAEEATRGTGPPGTADIALSTSFTSLDAPQAAPRTCRRAVVRPALRAGWLNGPRRMAPLCC
jgi:hypothetical protein